MADVTALGDMSDLVQQVLPRFKTLESQVQEIDEQLNADEASKTKLLNQAVKGVETDAEKLMAQVKDFVDSFHGADRVGLVHALTKSLKKEFADEVDAYVDENVKTSTAPKPSDEEQTALRNQRRELVKMQQAIYNLIEQFAPDYAANLTKPTQSKAFSGPRRKTGARLVGSFQWVIDGDNENPLSKMNEVQKRVGAGSMSDLWVSVETANPDFDRKSPPDSFSFTHGDHNVVATRSGSSSEEDDSSDDDETNSELFSEDI